VVSSDLNAVKDAKTILLTSYKRDGTPVETPVSIAFDGDRAFFREQARIAAKALARRHHLLQAILVPIAHRLMRYQTMHYELRSTPE
jgi:uncharacterized protein